MTTSELGAPVMSRWGSSDPAAPLVVLLHGRGATESDMVPLAPHLPGSAAYASVRAPIREGGGYAWFANRGIGRPLAGSLAETMAWFRRWLDGEAAPDRPVVLVGFSGGAAFAGGLLLIDPARFAAAGLLYGTLPFDAGVPVTRGRLAGVPVFLAHGVHDTVIPADLLRRTWDYLLRESGAPLWAEREPTGHELTATTVSALGAWIAARLDWLQAHPRPPAGETAGDPAHWPALPGGVLPLRAGAGPEVSATTPHEQKSQNAPAELQEQLFSRIAALDGVATRPSAVSVPGARAFVLDPAAARGPADAFMIPAVGEFAHLHPRYDGSLHLVLPMPLAVDALERGWASAHPLAGLRLTPGMVMVFGPRDADELDVVTGIVRASHAHAAG